MSQVRTRAAQVASVEPVWLSLARAEIGVKEIHGPNDNPTILDYFKAAAHPEIHDDETPWCAAFVGAMLKRANIKPSGSLAALSYASWGQPLASPILGCVGVKKRPGAGWVGHVGFVVGANSSTIFLLGGNTQDRVMVAAFARKEFVGFRWPANIEIPRNLPALPTTIDDAQRDARQD